MNAKKSDICLHEPCVLEKNSPTYKFVLDSVRTEKTKGSTPANMKDINLDISKFMEESDVVLAKVNMDSIENSNLSSDLERINSVLRQIKK